LCTSSFPLSTYFIPIHPTPHQLINSPQGQIDLQKLKALEAKMEELDVVMTELQVKEAAAVAAEEASKQAEADAIAQEEAAKVAEQIALDEEAKAKAAEQFAREEEAKARVAEQLARDEEAKARAAEQVALDEEAKAKAAEELALDEEAKARAAEQFAREEEAKARAAEQVALDEEAKAKAAAEDAAAKAADALAKVCFYFLFEPHYLWDRHFKRQHFDFYLYFHVLLFDLSPPPIYLTICTLSPNPVSFPHLTPL
jgi:hypothetical protein